MLGVGNKPACLEIRPERILAEVADILGPQNPRESFVHPHHPLEKADLFDAVDGTTIEVEFGSMLKALVRCYKPKLILETGTYNGETTCLLADACQENGFGKVVSLEINGERRDNAAVYLEKRGVLNAEVIRTESVPWIEKYDGPAFGFAFLDSDQSVKAKELKLLKEGKKADFALVHDTSRLRYAGGMRDSEGFPESLDALGYPSVECPLSRGWRLFDLR